MSVYSMVPIARPRRTAHNLSHEVDTSLNIGELIPTARPLECVPGDTIDISSIVSVDLMPLVRPFKGSLYLESWAFFVSNDMLYKPNDSGKFTDILVSASNPKEALSLPVFSSFGNSSDPVQLGTYWDYFGLPVGVGISSTSKVKIIQYPFRAVYKIAEDYFFDENLQSKPFTSKATGCLDGFPLVNVNYKKDRFTSAFRSEQKGNPITLGLGKSAPIRITWTSGDDTFTNNIAGIKAVPDQTPSNFYFDELYTTSPSGTGNDINYKIDVDLSEATAVTINDLRLHNKLQKWLERLQLCGSRPKEYLLANYGICPNDETLQRPVLIGHIKTPVIVDSVIQNLETEKTVEGETVTTPGATKYGNAATVSSTHFGKWLCKEFGWIIVLSALRPKSNYTQGIHRSLMKDTIYDFYNPIFESLGQQEIFNCEVYAQNTADDKQIWGYTDRYNEYRHIESMTTGAMRAGMENWVMSRKFGSLPTLGESFIKVQASEYDYLFNFEHSAELPQAVLHSVNLIKGIRPISKYPHPSL